MNINYFGLSCVSVTAKPQGGEVVAVLDPYDNATGLRFPRSLSADIVFSSQEGAAHGNAAAVGGAPFGIQMPGEYEVKGMMVDARRAPTKKNAKHMIARVIADGVSVGFLGGIDRALKSNELELMEGVDILILPVGGEEVLTPKLAVEAIQQIEPRVVVPVHYAETGIKAKLGTLAAFKKELGPVPTEEVNKLKMSKKQLPQEDMLLAILTRG